MEWGSDQGEFNKITRPEAAFTCDRYPQPTNQNHCAEPIVVDDRSESPSAGARQSVSIRRTLGAWLWTTLSAPAKKKTLGGAPGLSQGLYTLAGGA
jgi:hypothetical protein